MKLAGESKLFGNKITHCLGEVLTLILPIFAKNPYYLFHLTCRILTSITSVEILYLSPFYFRLC